MNLALRNQRVSATTIPAATNSPTPLITARAHRPRVNRPSRFGGGVGCAAISGCSVRVDGRSGWEAGSTEVAAGVVGAATGAATAWLAAVVAARGRPIRRAGTAAAVSSTSPWMPAAAGWAAKAAGQGSPPVTRGRPWRGDLDAVPPSFQASARTEAGADTAAGVGSTTPARSGTIGSAITGPAPSVTAATTAGQESPPGMRGSPRRKDRGWVATAVRPSSLRVQRLVEA
jgi:hypothetical protein